MAGVLGEFTAALPSPVNYCKKISLAEYERQGAEETQNELEKLLDYLDDNPRVYYRVLRKRKRDELGLMPWLKVSVMSALQGEEEYLDSYFPEGECTKSLEDLKIDLVSAYDYGQETADNGKRFSKRLAEKKKQAMKKVESTTNKKVTAPPLPPPPPPPVMPLKQPREDTENIENVQPGQRNVFSVKAKVFESEQIESPSLKNINEKLFSSMKNVSGRGHQTIMEFPPADNGKTVKDAEKQARLVSAKRSLPNVSSRAHQQKNLNDEIANARKKLKCIYPEGMTTPYQYSKQQRQAQRTPDQYPLFNVALVHKFRNARSPSISPSGCFNDSSSFCNDSPA